MILVGSSVADPGCFIPDPGCFIPDPGCFIPDPDPYIFHSGSRIRITKGLKINPTFFLLLMVSGASLFSKK
jgi:hypothetical protein